MPDSFPHLRQHLRYVLALLFLCTLVAGIKLEYLGLTPNSDYNGYLATAHLISGLPSEAVPARILKPLAPALVALVAPTFGFPSAFLFEVVFFYFAFALACYTFGSAFFADKRLGLTFALLAALSYPILRYGLDLYTETGALFFYVLSLFFTLQYLRAPSRKMILINGVTIGVGLLWKEYALVNGLVFGLVLLFESVDWKAKFQNLALLAFSSLLPTLLAQAWVYRVYHYTYLDWYRIGGATGFATEFTLRNIVKSIAALLGLAWFLVPKGLRYVRSLSMAEQRFLLFAIPPPCIALLWGYVSSRLFYVMAPSFLLLALLGLSKLPRPLYYPIAALIVLANVGWLTLSISA